MIVVTVDLISAIHPSRNQRLAQMVIANDGTSKEAARSSYTVSVGRKGQTISQTLEKPQRAGRVANHRRLALSVWVLVAKAIKAAGYFKEGPEQTDDSAGVGIDG